MEREFKIEEYRYPLEDRGLANPYEVMVSDELISLPDEEIDKALPVRCQEVGVMIYNADYSIIKMKDFDGAWRVVHNEST